MVHGCVPVRAANSRLHQQFELHSAVCIFQIKLHSQSLFLSLESFADIACHHLTIFPSGFSCSVPSFVWEKYISPFQVFGKLPGHDSLHKLSSGVLHCEDTVSVQLVTVLAWFGDWLEVNVWPILGNLFCYKAFFVQSEELTLVKLLFTDRFLMSEYLTLSGPGAVS